MSNVKVNDDKKVTILEDTLKENLSPGAIAAISAYICNPKTNNDSINEEIIWFRDYLSNMVGTTQEYNETIDALGL